MSNVSKYQPSFSTKPFFNSLLDEFFGKNIGDFVGNDMTASTPLVNVRETNDAFLLELAAPGYQKGDFKLNLEQDELTLSVEKEVKNEQTEERYTRREFRYDSFSRSFKLPKTVNQNAIAAVYENGVLLVTLPKHEASKPVVKTIEIG